MNNYENDFASKFVPTGEIEPMEVQQFRDILQDMGDLYARKNSDYGGAIEKAIHEFGYIYSACMLFNKLERFKNLIEKEDFQGKVGESLVDTLLDMANYAVETARVMQNDMNMDGLE